MFEVTLNITQTQKGYDVYEFPIDVKVQFKNQTVSFKTFQIDKRQKKIEFESTEEPAVITLDPSSWLLAKIQYEKNGSE